MNGEKFFSLLGGLDDGLIEAAATESVPKKAPRQTGRWIPVAVAALLLIAVTPAVLLSSLLSGRMSAGKANDFEPTAAESSLIYVAAVTGGDPAEAPDALIDAFEIYRVKKTLPDSYAAPEASDGYEKKPGRDSAEEDAPAFPKISLADLPEECKDAVVIGTNFLLVGTRVEFSLYPSGAALPSDTYEVTPWYGTDGVLSVTLLPQSAPAVLHVYDETDALTSTFIVLFAEGGNLLYLLDAA